MIGETIIQQLNDLLINSPLEDEFVDYWQARLPQMSEQELSELLQLSQERLAILTDSNNLLVKMAEDVDAYNQQTINSNQGILTFLDMKIETLADLFSHHLVAILTKEDFDLFEELDEYFLQESELAGDVQPQLKMLTESLLDNREILFSNQSNIKATIGVWLHNYLVAGSDQADLAVDSTDHSLRRFNFINQNEAVKRMPEADKDLLLKLLKLYDFLKDTSIEDIKARQAWEAQEVEDLEQLKQRELNPQTPATAYQPTPTVQPNKAPIAELEAMLARYPEGSLERLALEEELDKLKNI